MDNFKAELNKCGCGGIKCFCCRPTATRGKKDRTWTRHARRAIKQDVQSQIEAEIDDPA